MKKIIRFIQKYEFPLHVNVIASRVVANLSGFFSTLRFKCLLRWLGCSFGKDLRIDGMPRVRIIRRGSIVFGDNCLLKSRCGSNLVGKTTSTILECREGGNIRFGDHSGCSFAVISSRVGIDIGDHVNIGGNVRIFDHDYHSLNYMDRRNGKKDQENCRAKPIKIGDDVFIGTNSIILKGVSVGDRAIIGAGSVVSCDIPPDEIWGGNPARKIKTLSKLAGIKYS